jgi:ATP adenylyltransferase
MARAGLERLRSPWRMRYIRTAEGPTACLFCAVQRSRDDRAHLVLARRPGALLMLNRYPYNPAHLMVAVRRHVARFADLNAAEREDLVALTGTAERALELEYAPHGMNYGVNVGRIAGAGFPGHLHLHLVPRWSGDTNFMSTVGETRVLPESLAATWRRLRSALRAIERAGLRHARAAPPARRAKAAARARRGETRKAASARRRS